MWIGTIYIYIYSWSPARMTRGGLWWSSSSRSRSPYILNQYINKYRRTSERKRVLHMDRNNIYIYTVGHLHVWREVVCGEVTQSRSRSPSSYTNKHIYSHNRQKESIGSKYTDRNKIYMSPARMMRGGLWRRSSSRSRPPSSYISEYNIHIDVHYKES